jgi:hypothetical protein
LASDILPLPGFTRIVPSMVAAAIGVIEGEAGVRR